MSELHEHPRCPTCLHIVEPHEVLLDPTRGIVAHNGREARLSRHEFLLAQELIKAHPRAMDKDRLFDAIYSNEIAEADFPAPKIMDVFVCKVRKKLSPIGVIITTEWGYGWGITLADPKLAEALKEHGLRHRANRGYRWDLGYDMMVLELADRKLGLQQISRAIGMPYIAVWRAMDRLGLIDPTDARAA